MNKKALSILFAVFVLMTGCTMAPKYTRPQAPVPAEWPSGVSYPEKGTMAGAPSAPDLRWQEFFSDEGLQKVIETALNNNRDLRIAALNVERARAIYGIRVGDLLPSLTASASYSKVHVPADLSATRQSLTSEQYSVNFGIAAWEIDFFGRIRSLKDVALEQYFATEEARRSTQILLISSVAGAYLTLAADRDGLKLAQSTLEAQESAYKLVQRRFEIGLASELDLRQAQTQVDTARGDVARTTRRVAQDENGLNLLVGSASPLPEGVLPADLARVTGLKEIFPGLSSEVLLRRPDILSAEHNLKASNANIGAARAAFFPRISLTTLLGVASTDLSRLFVPGQKAWSFVPQAVMPIFDARLWSAYKVTQAEKEIAIAQYERAIQNAFRDVADALALRGTVDQQLSAQQSLVNAAAETYRLSAYRYEKGIDSYLTVLDSQRSLYAAQQGLIVLRLSKLANLVTLYAVLGGGA